MNRRNGGNVGQELKRAKARYSAANKEIHRMQTELDKSARLLRVCRAASKRANLHGGFGAGTQPYPNKTRTPWLNNKMRRYYTDRNGSFLLWEIKRTGKFNVATGPFQPVYRNDNRRIIRLTSSRQNGGNGGSAWKSTRRAAVRYINI
jgi:hypothetical protein